MRMAQVSLAGARGKIQMAEAHRAPQCDRRGRPRRWPDREWHRTGRLRWPQAEATRLCNPTRKNRFYSPEQTHRETPPWLAARRLLAVDLQMYYAQRLMTIGYQTLVSGFLPGRQRRKTC